jgi:hypothetical protein
MNPHPKDDAAKAESDRLTKRVKYLAWLPVACALIPCAWLTRLVMRRSTRGELRAADKARQSKVRRQLRGLSPVHDAGKHVS